MKKLKARAAPEVVGAAFAELEARLADASMWLHHAASWLQSEAMPSIPEWTGLAVERRYRMPSPGFLVFGVEAMDRAAGTRGPGVCMEHSQPELPESGLGPLGWDARTVKR